MVAPDLKSGLLSTEDLPCSDDTPVDNEEQNLLPNLLLLVLAYLWAERMDWYFGVDMAVYHTTGVSPKVPVVQMDFSVWELLAEREANLVAAMPSGKKGGRFPS
nr:hypothetical protein [Romeria gracilis]